MVEWVAHTLAEHSPARLPLRTPLTRRNWKQAWDERAPDRRRRRSRASSSRSPTPAATAGRPLPDRRRRYCEPCRSDRSSREPSGGRARQRRDRCSPAYAPNNATRPTADARAQLRGQKNAAHQRAVREWEGERPDPAVFLTRSCPDCARIPIPALVAATGLSEHYCSLIRLGKKVPHPRHWDVLRGLRLPPVQEGSQPRCPNISPGWNVIESRGAVLGVHAATGASLLHDRVSAAAAVMHHLAPLEINDAHTLEVTSADAKAGAHRKPRVVREGRHRRGACLDRVVLGCEEVRARGVRGSLFCVAGGELSRRARMWASPSRFVVVWFT